MSKNNAQINCYESGYGSDSSLEECSREPICPFCKKCISGPRIGMVVHYATKHTERSRQEISKLTTASEMHTFVTVRNRSLHILL
jgi:hypothetical protein